MILHFPEDEAVLKKDEETRISPKRFDQLDHYGELLQVIEFLNVIQSQTSIVYLESAISGIKALESNTTTPDLTSAALEQLRTALDACGTPNQELLLLLGSYTKDHNHFVTLADVRDRALNKLALIPELPPFYRSSHESALNYLAETQFLQQFHQNSTTFITKPQTLVDALTSVYLDKGVGYYAERKKLDRLPDFDIDEDAIPILIECIGLITTSSDQRLIDLIRLVDAHMTPAELEPELDQYDDFKLTSEERQDADLNPDSQIEVLEPQLITTANQTKVRFAIYSPFSDIFNGKGTEITTVVTHQGQEHVIDTRVINELTPELHALDKELIATENDRYTFRNSPVRFELELPEGVAHDFSVTVKARKHTKVVETTVPFAQLAKITEAAEASVA